MDNVGKTSSEHQATINPLRDYLHLEEEITVSRDYDSVLRITKEIVIECRLCIDPVSNPIDALSMSIHLNHDVILNSWAKMDRLAHSLRYRN